MKKNYKIKLLLFVIFLSITVISCASENTSNRATVEKKPMPNSTSLATESIVLGMGCFWGAEKRMSALNGVINVESGYAGGDDKNAGYNEVLGLEKQISFGKTKQINHAEVIKVSFQPQVVGLEEVLITFWENHNPTQGNRQGNDIGTNYRSAIYFNSPQQQQIAEKTLKTYQTAMSKNNIGTITTEIAPLKNYIIAEEYHQDYLQKNPNGYCGLGGTGVAYPGHGEDKINNFPALDAKTLNKTIQLIAYEAEQCNFCKEFKKDILDNWQSSTPIQTTKSTLAPNGWKLTKIIFATPTIVLFKNGKEIDRFTGYGGKPMEFWQWLGKNLLTGEDAEIAFNQATERAGTGLHLKENRNGDFVDPITGKVLFKSNTKFKSGTGWPSFSEVESDAVTLHTDTSHGMTRTEVRSASSGIHLGHLFNDGPSASGKRFCINGNVLKFMPKEDK
jgi:peptide methionine sulfoxide reductase msrA/msrB